LGLYIHSPIRLHGVVLKKLNTRTTLLFFTIVTNFGLYTKMLRAGRPGDVGSIPDTGSKLFFSPQYPDCSAVRLTSSPMFNEG
jgi:hypothetical protein